MMRLGFNKINGRIQNLTPPQIASLWILGTVFAIPLLFIILTPEGGGIALAFIGFVVAERTNDYFKERYISDWYVKLLTGLSLLLAFAAATGFMLLWLFPICRWLAIQETIRIQFLNRELTYGLALCYEGNVDFVTVGFGAFLHYLLWPMFYLLFQLMIAPYKMLKTLWNRGQSE
ncbi:MAG: hypothetical protein AAF490_19815 [Chloroflexota bacterium]